MFDIMKESCNTVLRSIISIPVHDLVKVTDTECFILNFIYFAALIDICDMPSQGYFKSWQKFDKTELSGIELI